MGNSKEQGSGIGRPAESESPLHDGMEYRRFGPTNREVSVLGQGTWYSGDESSTAAVAALRIGLDLGMNHIDTAEMYLDGGAERIVGQAIAARRHEVFLVSKVLPQNASLTGTIQACERSLARLKTDRLDCYLLHWRGQHPLRDTIAAFQKLRQQGKILSWGVSNFDENDLEEVREIDGSFACNQVLYHLKERAIEHVVIPWCENHRIAVVGYSPFGHDDFPGEDTPGGRLLREIAESHNATPRQVTLRFLLRQPGMFVIPKSSSPEHTAENAAAGSLKLTEEDVEQLDRAFPLGPKPRELPML
ncbi:MAG: aldo/keto reductase [Candidatus Korobacteraceae bacterium]